MNNQIQIVDNFLNEYCRSPTENEFIKLGGNLKKIKMIYGSYRKFLDNYGYDPPTKAKCVQMFDDRNNLIFEGSVNDICLKFNVTNSNVIRACNGQVKRLKYKYRCRYKEVKL